jgi:hypothetical protein
MRRTILMCDNCWKFLSTIALALVAFSAASSADSPTARKPDVKSTADKFVKETLKDPKASEAKLKGKVIELTGTVSHAGPENATVKGITLSAGNGSPATCRACLWNARCRRTGLRKPSCWLKTRKSR